MKKQIKNIILKTFMATIAVLTVSCKAPADVTTEADPYINSTLKNVDAAINYVGKVSNIYLPVHSSGKFTNGQIIPDYLGTGVDARFEAKLVEYDSLSDDIKHYVKGLMSTGARHLTYNDVNCKTTMDYVEFASFIDTRNGNVMKYDLTFFDESNTNLATMAKRLALSPDMEIDIDRRVYIKTGERSPQYKYPYAIPR